jgi:regulator of protease activity HflC (stomatin/prohibitin superfamily)
MPLFFVFWTVAIAWWLLWAVIAMAKKAYPMLAFLLISGLLWGLGSWVVAGGDSYAAFGLFVVPLLILPPMVRIVTEYERGILYRLGRMRAIIQPGLNLVFPLGIDIVRKVILSPRNRTASEG